MLIIDHLIIIFIIVNELYNIITYITNNIEFYSMRFQIDEVKGVVVNYIIINTFNKIPFRELYFIFLIYIPGFRFYKLLYNFFLINNKRINYNKFNPKRG